MSKHTCQESKTPLYHTYNKTKHKVLYVSKDIKNSMKYSLSYLYKHYNDEIYILETNLDASFCSECDIWCNNIILDLKNYNKIKFNLHNTNLNVKNDGIPLNELNNILHIIHNYDMNKKDEPNKYNYIMNVINDIQ